MLTRPVGDIDVLILGDPDRDQLYEALSAAEKRLGRSGAFHDTVASRPLDDIVPVILEKPDHHGALAVALHVGHRFTDIE